ncbi:hypothetical protein NHX12_008304 [Muraenolepis orangiensis]|uniref:Uncharacterized protein n=1 Tax=Muraenolepis orangiensis TaxID=630683 RepID=A0A9Q0I7Y6_9TELE|nr:hypothetical protein NHX12_008304 [Muraenolepis orangiensis]
MHCDRVSDCSKARTSDPDHREARYWSRKLYEFEANDPDSSSEGQSARSTERRKSNKGKQHKGKSRRRSRRRDTEESSREGSGEELDREGRTRCGKKRKPDSHRDTDSGPDGHKKKKRGRGRGERRGRKDWKEPAEEHSDDSSGN